MSSLSWPYAWPSPPRPTAGKARIYQANKDATGATPDTLTIPLPCAGKITRVELDAEGQLDFFKLADCYVRSPKSGGYAIRLARGQLLPKRSGSLEEHCDVNIQANSELTAAFYGVTSGVQIYVTVNIVEEP